MEAVQETQKIVVHLSSGKSVDVFAVCGMEEPEELALELFNELRSATSPGWMLIDSTLFYTAKISAIEFL